MYRDMYQWTEIRRRVLIEGVSKRQIQRETGLHWKTLEKILHHSQPPGYQMRQQRERPKLGPYMDRIRQILEEDKKVPKKQRHTGKRIFDRLAEEGYEGGITVVRDAIREMKRMMQEVYVPLVHRPGEAQVDYFHALAKVDGILRKVVVFVMALPYSDAFFVRAFERECTETFWEGHVRAFEYFGGVPRRISYDNSKIAVKAIVGVHARQLTDGFLQLVSHHLFDHHFCAVRRANEKGVVEVTGKYARQNFLVPVPQVRDLEELNRQLLASCEDDLQRRVRGGGRPKADLLEEDRVMFLPLPAAPFDACVKVSTQSNSLSLVRFDRNDYSVPVRYAHHGVTVKGYVDRVVICQSDKPIARHDRIWEKEKVSFEAVHYLALLERKPGALDHGRPFQEMELPECFGILRRRLENEHDTEGTREYIGVLRLLESYSVGRLSGAVEKALRFNALSVDVIRLYAFPDEERESATFRLDGREHLRGVTVARPDLELYSTLLVKEGQS